MQDERYLTGVDGMNAFAAAAILSQISLHDFLALRADQRLELVLPIPEGMIVGSILLMLVRHVITMRVSHDSTRSSHNGATMLKSLWMMTAAIDRTRPVTISYTCTSTTSITIGDHHYL